MSPNSITNSLLFSPGAVIHFGGNRFINVPVILQVEGTPLIEEVTNNDISRTIQFSLFNIDGTYLAQVVGTCLTRTTAGVKAGLEIKYPTRATICTIGDRILFEVRRVAAASLSITAELFSPTGLCVRSSDVVPFSTFSPDGNQVAIATIQNQRIRNVPVGFSVGSSGKEIVLGGNSSLV